MLAMLGQAHLARALFPVGEMTKDEVRAEALRLGLRTATKPDSQDVCFIRSDEGRQGFLGSRLSLHPGRLVDHVSGADLGAVDSVELVTVGQRRGMGHSRDGRRRFVTAVDVPARRVTLGPPEAAHADEVRLHTVTWVDGDRHDPRGTRPTIRPAAFRSRPWPSAAPTVDRCRARCSGTAPSWWSGSTPRSGGSPRGRPWRSTTRPDPTR